MLCNACVNALGHLNMPSTSTPGRFPEDSNGAAAFLLPGVHHKTLDELLAAVHQGCRICSVLKWRWEAEFPDLQSLPIRDQEARGLVSCFFHEASGSIPRIDFYMNFDDPYHKYAIKGREVGFTLEPVESG